MTILHPLEPGTGFGLVVAGAGDVNGDGFGDVLVGGLTEDDERGEAWLFLGSREGVRTNAAWSVKGLHPRAQYGIFVSSLGDVNGDGLSDFGVGAPRLTATLDRQGAAYAYFGRKDGVSTNADWAVIGNQETGFLGGEITAAGDVNGDGFGDVIVCAINHGALTPGAGRVLAFHGSSNGLGPTPDWEARGNQTGGSFGGGAAAAGDINKDGFGDIIIGEPNRDEEFPDEGIVRVFLGSKGGLATNPTWTATFRPPAETAEHAAAQLFGNIVHSAGDVNRDGWPDILVAAYYGTNGERHEGMALLFHGSPDGLPQSPSWYAEGNQAHALLGSGAAPAGDLNGDGFDDVIVGAPMADRSFPDEGFAAVFLGSSAGLSRDPAWTADGGQRTAYLGNSVAGVGDVNGDGFADVAVAARGIEREGQRWGEVKLHYGSGGGLRDTSGWPLRKTWLSEVRTSLNAVMGRTGWLMLSGSAVFVCASTALLVLFRRRQLATNRELEMQRAAVATERTRLARDLHDGLGSELARLVALADPAQAGGKGNASIVASARVAMRAVDEVVWATKPAEDTLESLIGFLTDLAEEYFLGTGIDLDLKMPLDVPEVRVTSLERANIVFIIKESFANIIKHSGASALCFSVSIGQDGLKAIIHDDGRGFPNGVHDTGKAGSDGVRNMQTRAREINADIQIRGTQEGTTVCLAVPLRR